MNCNVGAPSPWTGRKRCVIIVLCIGLQVALLVWLSERGPLHPRKAEPHPAILLAAMAQEEVLPLTDPTLFSTTHPEGFSGQAWLNIVPHGYVPVESGT